MWHTLSSVARPRYPMAGRTAVVTGAASGIGRALALDFAARGCPVAIADNDADGLEETRARIGDGALARELDVSDRQAMFAFAAQVSAVAVTAGAAANAKYTNGVAVFTMAKGGLMYEASVGGQKFGFQPFAKK